MTKVLHKVIILLMIYSLCISITNGNSNYRFGRKLQSISSNSNSGKNWWRLFPDKPLISVAILTFILVFIISLIIGFALWMTIIGCPKNTRYCTPKQLVAEKFTPEMLDNYGITPESLLEKGATASDLAQLKAPVMYVRRAGADDRQLRELGYNEVNSNDDQTSDYSRRSPERSVRSLGHSSNEPILPIHPYSPIKEIKEKESLKSGLTGSKKPETSKPVKESPQKSSVPTISSDKTKSPKISSPKKLSKISAKK